MIKRNCVCINMYVNHTIKKKILRVEHPPNHDSGDYVHSVNGPLEPQCLIFLQHNHTGGSNGGKGMTQNSTKLLWNIFQKQKRSTKCRSSTTFEALVFPPLSNQEGSSSCAFNHNLIYPWNNLAERTNKGIVKATYWGDKANNLQPTK